MTQFLPGNLLALFAPRDPLPYLPPPQPKHSNELCTLVGIGSYLSLFEDPVDTPLPQKVPTRAERREAKRKEKDELQKNLIEQRMQTWDPHNDENASADAFKTVFVARINYDTREDKLQREFEEFGYIKKIHMVRDVRTGKPRGYAFIEYETEKGMRAAFKYGDGRKIDGRRVVVDIERGRTVKNWKPRRFGGGLGGTRIGAPEINVTHSGRVDPRQYQDKLARAQRMRERVTNTDAKDDSERARSKERSKSRDKSERARSSEREKSVRDEDKTADRRMPRASDRKDEKEKEKSRDDDRRRERDDPDRRRDRDGDRKRERRDDDRDRDRKRDRRDRDDRKDRGDRDRERDEDKDRDREGDKDREREGDKSRTEDRNEDRDRERGEDRDREREDSRDARERENVEDVKIKEEPIEEEDIAAAATTA